MISDIPTSIGFHTAGLNQLCLASQIAMQVIGDYERVEAIAYESDGGYEEAAASYWAKSQPALAHAFGLIQQSMEMALKGRIAEISLYLR